MHLIQILLPIRDNAGATYPGGIFAEIRDMLMSRFGGLTSFTRAPGRGYWEEGSSGTVVRDDVVVFEVMASELDVEWWSRLRQDLCRLLRQTSIVVRSQEIRLL